MNEAVLVFAKVPAAGSVKTRLIPCLGAGGAAALHAAMVADLLARLQRGWETILYTDKRTEAWPEFSGERRLQREGDLGTRMLAALAETLSGRHGRAVLVGSDAPHLPLSAVRRLMDCDADVALGPALDGGYWGIAARATRPAMFRDVSWSTARALVETVQACRSSGLTVAFGPAGSDVDSPRNLGALYRHLQARDCPRTARLLRMHSMCRKLIHF